MVTQRSASTAIALRLFLVASIIFSSCADRIKTNIIAYRALEESLSNSNVELSQITQWYLSDLENKETSPRTLEKAKVWLPKAKLISDIAASHIKYIEQLKTDLRKEAGAGTGGGNLKENEKAPVMRLFTKKGKGLELYQHLKACKQEMLAVDSFIKLNFVTNNAMVTKSFDASIDQEETFTKTFFNDLPTVAALAMLNKFENNIRILEIKLIEFCNNQVFHHGYFSFYSAIRYISSKIARPNDELEIVAGVGDFSKAAIPEITISGKKIPLQPEGFASFKFRAPEKVGKHIVNVEIGFIDQEGNKRVISGPLEYTVIDPKQGL